MADIENAMVNDAYWSDFHAWGYAQNDCDEYDEYEEYDEYLDDLLDDDIDDEDEEIVAGIGYWRRYNDYWL